MDLKRILSRISILLGVIFFSAECRAADVNVSSESVSSPPTSASGNPSVAVPLGVFGVGLPKKSQITISVQPSFIKMGGSLDGTQSISPQFAATNIYTNYSPVGTHVVRNVPLSSELWSEAIGVSYGITNNLAVTFGTVYLEKQQGVLVFNGMSGTTARGVSNAGVHGFGDSSLAGIWRVYKDPVNQIDVNFGLSLPTGSATADETTFNNSGVYSTKRAVYSMQLGTGTVDALFGAAYAGVISKWSWGLSYRGRIPLDDNSEGYRWGDYHELNVWGGYTWTRGLDTTLRFSGSIQGPIVGYDRQLFGYGPCTDPLWYGGDRIDILPGASISGRYFGIPAATMAFEVSVPVYQYLNGLHTARDYAVLVGIKYKL